MRLVETRPSGANRWTKCSAAPLFASRSPEQPDNDPAREGTCAAWVAELVLKNQVLRATDLLGECHANGWQVDLEMCGHVQGYVDMIRADGGLISTERHVRLSPLVAGTLDNAASFINIPAPTNGPPHVVLRVRDFKYGFKLIEPDSPQVVIYAGALMNESIAQGMQVREVWTEIYQPRGFHPDGIHRRKKWDPAELSAQCEWIKQRAEECHKPNPVATPGSHCIDCEAATGCATLQMTAVNILTHVNDDRFSEKTPQELSNQLTFLREAKKIVTAATSATETEALTRHQSGERIPGYYMKERFGHKKLTAGRNAIKALTGVDPVKEVLMSPAELKAAGVNDRQLSLLSRKPPIGHKLEPLDQDELKRDFERKQDG